MTPSIDPDAVARVADDSQQEFEFDVALSFAGEDRDFADQVAERAKAAGLRVFLDSDYQAEMWGHDLVEYFDDVYRRRSRFAVIFASRAYAAKTWTRHERRSALARGLDNSQPYVLPVRLEDVDLPGLRPTVAYLDARQVGVAGIAEAVITRCGASPAASVPLGHVPTNEVERQQLLIDRPAGWEYACLAGELRAALARLDTEYHDHQLGYAASSVALELDQVGQQIRYWTSEASATVRMLVRLMDPEAQQAAMGEPGVEGDPGRIEHLARRWAAIYESWLDLAARIRGASAPARYERALSLLGDMLSKPIDDFREFVEKFEKQINEALPRVARSEQVELQLTFSIEIDEDLTRALYTELDRLSR